MGNGHKVSAEIGTALDPYWGLLGPAGACWGLLGPGEYMVTCF
jgi:hypothetical protein